MPESTIDPSYLLTDEQMQQYIRDGYVVLKTTLPPEAHQSIYDKTEEVFEVEGNPGNNILPRVPDLRHVFDDPAIRGALTSVLGTDYAMHSHRHPHINRPNGKAGGWHKDSYWGYYKIRSHRSRWAMIFYYPQDVTEANGPTAVIPGTQYFMNRAEDTSSEVHVPVIGEAGTATLVHFDIWHQASANNTDVNRYMMKFQFRRMSEPQKPSWSSRTAEWQRNDASNDIIDETMWNWHCGHRGTTAMEGADVADLAKAFDAPSESVRLGAAYALGSIGEPAIPVLMDGLRNGNEDVQLAAAYGLGVNNAAVEALAEAIEDSAAHVRKHAAYALGEQGASAGVAGVVPLTWRVEDEDVEVRRQAAEALGIVECHPEMAVPALMAFMKDDDPQTRYTAAYSLSSFGERAAAAVPALTAALEDDNRYVSGHAVSALRRIGTPEAEVALLDYLVASRWCAMTTKESTF